MSNWLKHVKETMKLHPGKPLKDVLKLAKGTYKKAEGVVKYAVTGKKSRKSSRKGSRKAKTAKRARKPRRSRRSRK